MAIYISSRHFHVLLRCQSLTGRGLNCLDRANVICYLVPVRPINNRHRPTHQLMFLPVQRFVVCHFSYTDIAHAGGFKRALRTMIYIIGLSGGFSG